MAVELFLECPIAPKKNRMRAAVSKYGKVFQYKDKRVRDLEAELMREIWIKTRTIHVPEGLPYKEPVHVEAFYPRGRADMIGRLETLLDAMQNIVYENDRQVVSFAVAESMRTYVKVTQISELSRGELVGFIHSPTPILNHSPTDKTPIK